MRIDDTVLDRTVCGRNSLGTVFRYAASVRIQVLHSSLALLGSLVRVSLLHGTSANTCRAMGLVLMLTYVAITHDSDHHPRREGRPMVLGQQMREVSEILLTITQCLLMNSAIAHRSLRILRQCTVQHISSLDSYCLSISRLRSLRFSAHSSSLPKKAFES